MTMMDVTLEWDTADRIRKAMRAHDMGVQELAEALDVSRNTIGNWINGRVDPSVQSLYAIAAVVGVPFEWLKTGTAPSGDGAELSRPWESNPRPSHYKVNGSPDLGGAVMLFSYMMVRSALGVSS